MGCVRSLKIVKERGKNSTHALYGVEVTPTFISAFEGEGDGIAMRTETRKASWIPSFSLIERCEGRLSQDATVLFEALDSGRGSTFLKKNRLGRGGSGIGVEIGRGSFSIDKGRMSFHENFDDGVPSHISWH